MGYVLVNKQTGVKHRNLPRNGGSYKTLGAARAIMTRYAFGRGALGDEWEIMEEGAYRAQVPMVKVRNLMSDVEIEIPADQAGTCVDPSTERYWSM